MQSPGGGAARGLRCRAQAPAARSLRAPLMPPMLHIAPSPLAPPPSCWPAQLARAPRPRPCAAARAAQQKGQPLHAGARPLTHYAPHRSAARQQQYRKKPPAVVYLPNFLHPDDAETVFAECRKLRCGGQRPLGCVPVAHWAAERLDRGLGVGWAQQLRAVRRSHLDMRRGCAPGAHSSTEGPLRAPARSSARPPSRGAPGAHAAQAHCHPRRAYPAPGLTPARPAPTRARPQEPAQAGAQHRGGRPPGLLPAQRQPLCRHPLQRRGGARAHRGAALPGPWKQPLSYRGTAHARWNARVWRSHKGARCLQLGQP